jgi:hypothetical protein
MTFSIEPWHLISMVIALIGGYWALVKVIVWQFNKNLDTRFTAQDEVRTLAGNEWNRRFDALERGQAAADLRFTSHLLELPEKYQRREDAIRQEVAIISRLDGLGVMVEKKFHQTDMKIEGLRRNE